MLEKIRKNVKLWAAIKISLLVPIVLLAIVIEGEPITAAELFHWFVHLGACILVCETVHSCKHQLTEDHHEHS